MAQRAAVVRLRRGVSEWRELIAEQADSGLSQRAFCESRGLALASFTKAKRRYAKQQSASLASDFIPVERDAAGSSAWEVELTLGDGIRLRLRRS